MNWLNDLLSNDPDPTETREWVESLKAVIDNDGPERAHQLLDGMVELTRRAGAHLPFAPTTEYINTIPPTLEAKIARRRGDGMAHPFDHPLERAGDGRARQPQAGRPRRPHRVLRLGGHAVRRGLQPLLARPDRRAPGRPALHPGPQLAGHLRAQLPGRPHQRIAARQLPHGSRRPRHQLLSAPVADARLLADADGQHGPGPDLARSTRRASGSTSKAAA